MNCGCSCHMNKLAVLAKGIFTPEKSGCIDCEHNHKYKTIEELMESLRI